MDTPSTKDSLKLAIKSGQKEDIVRLTRQYLHEGCAATDVANVGQKITKAFERHSELLKPDCKILFLGQSTTSWLSWALVSHCVARGICAEVVDGEYDSIFQELQTRDLSDFQFIILLPDNKALYESEDLPSTAEMLREFWSNAWSLIHERSKATVIQVGYDPDRIGSAGLNLSSRVGPIRVLRDLNRFLQDHLQKNEFYVDLEYLASCFGRDRLYERRRYYWTKQTLSEEGVSYLAHYLSAAIKTLVKGCHKVLALDLDNTMWGGVVGEEGPQGIELGISAEGEAFTAFQKYVKQLYDRGIILTVASKNNHEDALAPFRENTQMIVKEDHIASFKAHWDPKPLSLEQSATELNLGIDSFVFFDDNPVEREMVASALPEVSVVPVPADPANYIDALESGFYFESVNITEDDRQRAASYATEGKRLTIRNSFHSVDDFLGSLNLKATVEPVNNQNISRVVQLIGKTNQFNLTTLRLTDAQVEQIIEQGETFCFSLKDKFGEYGLVGIVLLAPHENGSSSAIKQYDIPIFLMSCRAIARSVEHFMINAVVQKAREVGVDKIHARYIPTKKNAQVSNLYDSFGFSHSRSDNDVKFYELDVQSYVPVKTFVQES